MGVEVVLNIGLGSCITNPVSDGGSGLGRLESAEKWPMKRQVRLQVQRQRQYRSKKDEQGGE